METTVAASPAKLGMTGTTAVAGPSVPGAVIALIWWDTAALDVARTESDCEQGDPVPSTKGEGGGLPP